jgi:hypothetical protein
MPGPLISLAHNLCSASFEQQAQTLQSYINLYCMASLTKPLLPGQSSILPSSSVFIACRVTPLGSHRITMAASAKFTFPHKRSRRSSANQPTPPCSYCKSSPTPVLYLLPVEAAIMGTLPWFSPLQITSPVWVSHSSFPFIPVHRRCCIRYVTQLYGCHQRDHLLQELACCIEVPNFVRSYRYISQRS